MASYMSKIGEKFNSPAIKADAKHQRVDILTCIAIVVAVVGSQLGFPILDPLVALLIVALILRTAFGVAQDNINNILGKVPSNEISNDIKAAALSIDGVSGIHNIKINYFGPYATVDIHIEVKSNLNVAKAHEISTKVEKKIINTVNIITSVSSHICITSEKGVCFD